MTPRTAIFSSIVLTTDLSTDAASAYEVAASLADTYKSSLTLLTCIDTSTSLSEPSFGALEAPVITSPLTLKEEYTEVEQALQSCLAANFDPVRTHYRIIQAPVPVKSSIVSFISETAPDLIVMSSHGRSGIARALLGSVTEHVLRHSKRPVLVVPASSR